MDSPQGAAQVTRADSVVDSDEGFGDSFAPTGPSRSQAGDNLTPESQSPLASIAHSDISDISMMSERKRKRVDGADEMSPGPDRALDGRIQTAQSEPVERTSKRLAMANEPDTSLPQQQPAIESPEWQVGSASRPQSEEDLKDCLDEKVAKLLQVTNTTDEDARELLGQTHGDPDRAILIFLDCSAPSLVQKALAAMAPDVCSKYRRNYLRQGEVLIVLEARNLSLSCRLRAEDLRNASSWFAESLSTGPEPLSDSDGVKYLYTLQSSATGYATPHLMRRGLEVLKRDCEGLYALSRHSEALTLGVGGAESKKPDKVPKQKLQDEPLNTAEKSVDWLKAYESFFRMISHVKQKHVLISQKSVKDALPRIEAVAALVDLYGANFSGSAVTSAFKSLFDTFDEKWMLWSTIAGDPVRCVKIGAQLRKPSVYEEAFIHVASSYPNISLDGTRIPVAIEEKVVHRAREMQNRHMAIDNDLLTLTLKTSGSGEPEATVSPKTDYLAYSVLVYFKEWLSEHIRYHRSTGQKQLTSAFCDHKTHDCDRHADFYRLLSSNHDYLPDTQVFEALARPSSRRDSTRDLEFEKKENVRSTMKVLRAEVARIVKPIVKSSLRWTGGNSLSYLTNLTVGEEDYPWAREAKREESVTDGEDYDDDTDMEG